MAILTIYTCDRCGRESDDSSFNNGSRSGKAEVTMIGADGGKTHDGAWGGYSYKRRVVICFSCAAKFREWFEDFISQKEAD